VGVSRSPENGPANLLVLFQLKELAQSFEQVQGKDMSNNNQAIGFRLGFIALLFIVAAAYFSQGCALVATDQVPDPSAVIDPPLTCYADSSPQCGFVYSCNEPSPNPGLEGRCAPMPDAKGIRREVGGKADIWCCDPAAPKAR
jgi:hypothetical protein